MKKFTIILTVLIAMTITTKAQWVTQNSTTTDTLSSVYFVDANTGYANGGIQDFGAINHILLKTTNGGNTWTNLNFNHLGFSIYFTDASNGYMSGLDTIFKTTDGGASWTNYPLGLGTVIVMDVYFFNASVGYATAWDYNSNATYMFNTTNSGTSWASVSGGVAGGQLGGIFCTSATTCYAVGWNGGHGVYKTTNGGNTWNFLSDPSISSDCGAIYFTSTTNGIVAGGNYIYQTTNGGSSWNPVYNNSNDGPVSVSFADANNGFAVGKSGTIVKTTDGGTTWNPVSSPTTNDLNSVHFPTTTACYAVGSAGTIIKYTGSNGIEENNNFTSVNIFPNPASDIVTLNSDNINNTDLTLDIYNLIGNIVKSENLKQNNRQFTVGDLSNGVYMVKIKSKDLTENQRLIIQR